MWCADCESVDDYFFDETHFWFFLPTQESFGKLARMCGESGLEAHQVSSHCIRVVLKLPAIGKFLTTLSGCLDGPEFGNTKVTTTRTDDTPDIHAIGMVTTADVLVKRYQARWLHEAISRESFESWFQPIVHASSVNGETRVFANEALFRLRDEEGAVIPPNIVFPLAEQSDLLFSLDLVARRSAVECAAKGNLQGKLFINFNPSSIYDPSYCLRTTAAAISEIGLKPEDVVFEITETHKADDINHLKGILSFYRRSGFGVALDDIGSGWSGLNLLEQLRPDYVKLDMELIRDIDTNHYKQNIVQHLIQIADHNRIRVVAEGIETKAEAQTVASMGADFLQGYYFGRPAAVSNQVSEQEEEKISASLNPLEKAARLQ